MDIRAIHEMLNKPRKKIDSEIKNEKSIPTNNEYFIQVTFSWQNIKQLSSIIYIVAT